MSGEREGVIALIFAVAGTACMFALATLHLLSPRLAAIDPAKEAP